MKAIVYVEPNKVELREVPMPEPGKDEVLIKVLRVGVCGSDINMLNGKMPVKPGTIVGHEFVGIRMDTNEKVVVNPLIYCGRCRPCRMGKVNICDHSAFFGDGNVPGAYAEYVTAQVSRVIPVDDLDIPDEKLVLAEPLAVGLHATELAPITEGPVAVVGAGTIGIAVTYALKQRGIKTITVADFVEARHPIAKSMGATETVTELVSSDYEAIFDCVGSLQTRATLLDKLMSGGTLVNVGALAREFNFRSTPIARFGKTLTGSFGYKDGNLTAGIFNSAGIEDLSWCRTVDFEDGADALNDLLAGKADPTQLKLIFKMA